MRKLFIMTGLTAIGAASVVGCGASSAQDQHRALQHQQNADEAADQGQYGVAGDEQRRAEDAHASAVQKAMDEGKPIPRQTRKGDKAKERLPQ